MTVVNAKTSFYAGNKRTLKFSVVDEDTAGSPAFDLTGQTIKFTLSRGDTDNYRTTAIVEKSSATPSQITITNATGGLVEVVLLGSDTLVLRGDFYFELELTDVFSDTNVVSVGTLEILRNVVNTL